MKCNNFLRIFSKGNIFFLFFVIIACFSSFKTEFLAAGKAKLSAAAGAKAKAKDSLPKMDDVITDKEIQELLKDPKYADIASNPELVKSLTASLKEEPLTSSSPSKTPHRPTHTPPASHSHYMSPSYKAHLARVKHTTPSAKPETLGGLDEDILKVSKNDLMKDLSLDNMPLDTSVSPLNKSHKPHPTSSEKTEEKPEKEDINDKFKDFDFLTKQQARYLIEILKQPVFMNMLPAEAQNIIKV